MGALAGVEKVEVDFKAKVASVTMKTGSLTKEDAEKALKSKGFGLSSFAKK
ncbi:MAG: hypothetical protein EXS14_05550 [Planctomycetes bacterium]|nr:hypothetical protein [Planctomycetota bacterium]